MIDAVRARWPARRGPASRRRRPWSAPPAPAVAQVLRVHRRVARDLRPDDRVALGHAAQRPGLGRGEGHERRGVGLAHAARVVDLAAEHDQDPQAGGGLAGRDADGVAEVGRAVGARRRGGADGAGDHDRRLGVVDHVAQHRRLLQRVGAVGDDHADAAPGGVARLAADVQLVLERQVRAGHVDHRLGVDAVGVLQPGHRRQQRRPVQLRGHAAVAVAGHGDGSAGGQHPHAPRVLGLQMLSHTEHSR